MSVTTWNHSHFAHFDADKIITKMMNGKNWKPGYKYYGKTREEIKKMWDDNRDQQPEMELPCITILNVFIII